MSKEQIALFAIQKANKKNKAESLLNDLSEKRGADTAALLKRFGDICREIDAIETFPDLEKYKPTF